MKPDSGAPLLAELGIEPVIHCGGTKTLMGGTRTDSEVRDAMRAAADVFVPVAELGEAVGRYIASVTGAQAGLVTSGAAAACVLSMAACMTGTDPGHIARLPDTLGMRNELILMRTHVGRYTHLYRRAGGHIVEVGTMNECHLWEILSAVTERTAAIGWLEGPGIRQVGPELHTICQHADRLGLPVIVDAAAMLPPKENLGRYISEGAALVAISGGKVIRGPQDTGLLYGRADLVAAATANASPYQGIGRPFKVTREDMIGLYVALKRYIALDEGAEIERLRARLQPIRKVLCDLPWLRISIEHDADLFHVPTLVIENVRATLKRKPSEVSRALLAGRPRIYVPGDDSRDQLSVNPISMLDHEAPLVAMALTSIFASVDEGSQ